MSCNPPYKQNDPVTWYGVFLPGKDKPLAVFPFRTSAAMYLLETGLDNQGAEIRPMVMGASEKAIK